MDGKALAERVRAEVKDEIAALGSAVGLATVLVRGNSERARSGGETGYVRWDGGPTRLRLTIEARNVNVDPPPSCEVTDTLPPWLVAT